MGNAQATASVIVEQGSVAQDVATKAAAIALEAGIASATADPGNAGIVEIDIAATADAGTKAVDNVDAGEAASGTWALTVDGVQTAPIAFDALAAAVKAALEALPNINGATVTGLGTTASPFNVTIDDPVGPHVLAFVDIDLGTPDGGEGVTEDTAGVLPSATAGATAITNAITAVDDVQLRDGAVDLVANPVPVATSATPSISVNDAIASVSIATTLTGSAGAVLRLYYVSAGVVAATPNWVRFDDFGDPVKGSNFNAGSGRIIFNQNGAVTNGTYVFVVEAEDDNGNKGYEVVTLSVSNQA